MQPGTRWLNRPYLCGKVTEVLLGVVWNFWRFHLAQRTGIDGETLRLAELGLAFLIILAPFGTGDNFQISFLYCMSGSQDIMGSKLVSHSFSLLQKHRCLCVTFNELRIGSCIHYCGVDLCFAATAKDLTVALSQGLKFSQLRFLSTHLFHPLSLSLLHGPYLFALLQSDDALQLIQDERFHVVPGGVAATLAAVGRAALRRVRFAVGLERLEDRGPLLLPLSLVLLRLRAAHWLGLIQHLEALVLQQLVLRQVASSVIIGPLTAHVGRLHDLPLLL